MSGASKNRRTRGSSPPDSALPLRRHRQGARRRRPQARGVVTRTRLLEVARELFVREGYASVSRADIARHAGCGVNTVYYHFPDTRSMLLELIDEWGTATPVQRRTALDVRTALAGQPRRAVHEFVRRSYDDLRKAASLYRVILAEARRDPEVRRRYESARNAMTGWITDMLRMGQLSGLLRSELKTEAAGLLLHHVLESMLLELVTQPLAEDLRTDVLDQLAEMICAFLLAEPRRPQPTQPTDS